ncbi:A24 family peptidase [Streptomyces sp. N2-109]|uniref:A24 family peptidase n=1 Tax=Streptomyces gossypii TaxID=2883101 RepID=A0ABT2JVX7_9ACTN|nr:A24 family peptidase [Streptomyces gossypii]MCT2591991.1 A24 family peptidase [Streptomyces gossypii]
MLWTVLAAGYGAAAGLLLPRAVYRLAVEPDEPRRDQCPQGHPLGGPARGWLGVARCRTCARPYGPRARFYVLSGALVCGGLAAVVGVRPELVVWLLAVPVALLLAAVDRAVHRLPDVLTVPLAAGTGFLLGVAALLPGAAGSWPRALLGGVALGLFYFILFLANSRGLGFGDVKLALALGTALGWYGWDVLLAGAFLGSLLLAVYGAALVVTGRAGRRAAVPFGPFMVLGALAGVLLGGLAG